MKLITRMLAAVGVVALAVLIINTASAGASKVIDAYDRQQASEKAMIDEHKLYLASRDDDFYVTDPIDSFDQEAYEASEQYKTARHANQFIAKAYGRE
ncbi:hypothetical protein J3492_00145 [Psychrobacter sp. F1192]|uniref:Uncharacterized protein n=1 Tax=Psychrobacter coccoides TaxID=2818440 RepID=A0ABS3NJU7_9GAMM|nr:hypothetical protein [Psychrobacter coccoides]MBO1529623.1 hypothetical protein [Psychrobacter coccoides]